MVKECKVLLRNQYVMVVDFDGKEVQMPSDLMDVRRGYRRYHRYHKRYRQARFNNRSSSMMLL